MADFTVYEDIISDGEAWLTTDDKGESGERFVTATFAYPVNMDEVRARRPEAVASWFKVLNSETFCEGEELRHEFGGLVRDVAEGKAYDEYKAYVREHSEELPDPCRRVRVVLNNPNCFPDAAEKRKRQVEELGRYLGRLLGLGKR